MEINLLAATGDDGIGCVSHVAQYERRLKRYFANSTALSIGKRDRQTQRGLRRPRSR